MPVHRLVEALHNADVEKIDRSFGNELVFRLNRATTEFSSVKRVALFAESFPPKIDGVSKSAYLTLRYLQQTGREVLVFAPDTSVPRVGPTRVVRLRALGLPFAPETRVAYPPMLSINRHLDDFQPDLIHCFSPALMSVSAIQAGRKRGIPVIANYQTNLPDYAKVYGLGVFSSFLRNWLRYMHNASHLTLVPSQQTLNELHDDGFKRLRVWRRGVNQTRFDPKNRTEAFRARLLAGRDPNSLLCIYVGRIAQEKRIDLLLEIARTPGVALTIIGDGAARDELQALFEGTDAVFTGYLVGDELSQAFASADVFTFASPSETFGQVVQEAMAAGLPCVIINKGGITDLVQNGENGFVCPPDPHAFAKAVSTLRDNPDLRLKMAAASRAKAEQNPWEAIMAQLEGYYEEAVTLNDRYNRAYGVGLAKLLNRVSRPIFTNY